MEKEQIADAALVWKGLTNKGDVWKMTLKNKDVRYMVLFQCSDSPKMYGNWCGDIRAESLDMSAEAMNVFEIRTIKAACSAFENEDGWSLSLRAVSEVDWEVAPEYWQNITERVALKDTAFAMKEELLPGCLMHYEQGEDVMKYRVIYIAGTLLHTLDESGYPATSCLKDIPKRKIVRIDPPLPQPPPVLI
jgi:hypothetical protein